MVKILLPKQSAHGAVEYAELADQCKDLFSPAAAAATPVVSVPAGDPRTKKFFCLF